MAHMTLAELKEKLAALDPDQAALVLAYAHGYCPEAFEEAFAREGRTQPRAAKAKAAAHKCACGHLEAFHVGAVLGDKNPGQCTDGDDCDCQRYSAAVLTAVAS